MNKFLIILLLTYFDLCKTKYVTWSLENGTYNDFMNDAIMLWQIEPLEFARAKRGEGKIKIYFIDLPDNDPRLGYAYRFKFGNGNIFLRNDLEDKKFIFYVLQHEIGHVLGLPDNDDEKSIMYGAFRSDLLPNTTDFERERVLDTFLCEFDSVTLLNGYSYFVFAENRYKRLDLNSLAHSDRGKLWHPFVTVVDAMYRSTENGNYVIVSGKEYFELDFRLRIVKQGFLDALFPYVPYVDAVVQLRNGSVFVFSNTDVYKDHRRTVIDKLNYDEGSVRGAFQTRNDSILIVDRRNVWQFDKNFKFEYKIPLCETKYFSKIHCCS